MGKQYLVCVQQKHQLKSGEYWNLKALLGTSLKGRYYTDLKQAVTELQRYIATQNRGEHTETQYVNGIGIEMVIDAETAKDFAIVDWYIKEREVTPWKEVMQMNYTQESK